MHNKILIANRGEIACRVIKTARRLGIATVAVYSDADANALHVRMADEAVRLGPASSRDSYLRADRVLQAARQTGAQAVHPGYGFLSENPEFSRACADADICFIGPPAAAIEAMGSKSAAKRIMGQAGVPLVPGYHGDDQNPATLKSAADTMGYPVLLKATAGGGGKGMRQVWSADEFDEALAAAKRESLSAFGDERMLVEKYLTEPRHVEIQIFRDQHGNALYLAERDCSIQRRHQKIIEEAPAPGMTADLRKAMGEAAVLAAEAIDYQGAGTVEFLLDRDQSFYFMEMNTRLQVEHPVTEMITGIDLVEWQLRVAAGEPLPIEQNQVHISGHAFEARIYAEDPDNDFLPVAGTLDYLRTPLESEQVRVDTGVVEGDEVTPYYDPMIAKLVVWGENRDAALNRLVSALGQYLISGTTTNIAFLSRLAGLPAFRDAQLDTGFIDKNRDEIFRPCPPAAAEDIALAALFLQLTQAIETERTTNPKDPHSPWNTASGWRLNQRAVSHFKINVEGIEQEVSLESLSTADGNQTSQSYRIQLGDELLEVSGRLTDDLLEAVINGHRTKARVAVNPEAYCLFSNGRQLGFDQCKPDLGQSDDSEIGGALRAPMNGTIISLLVEPGSTVSKGETLLVMEAMKMEHSLRAPADGRVNQFFCKPGDLVDGGIELLDFELTGVEL